MTSPGAAVSSSFATRRLLARGLIIIVALVLAWFFRDPPRANHDPLGTPETAPKGQTAQAPDDRRPITPIFADEPAGEVDDLDRPSRNIDGNAADARERLRDQASGSRSDAEAVVDESPSNRKPEKTLPASSKGPPKVPVSRPPVASSGVPPPKAEQDDAKKIVVRNVTIRDQSNRVIYKGDVDLTPTLERIEKGVRNEHRNDGSTFQNREGKLPRRPSGYYKEYVHPTPRQSGPGPQRIVMGREGEVYYTHDHYHSFRKLK